MRALLQVRQIRTDACGLPVKPTWSLRQLVSSYPSPSLSPSTFHRLHELSALVPPKEGTPEYDTTKKELVQLIRLVEAVKSVDAGRSGDGSIPDGRIWAEDTGIDLVKQPVHDKVHGTNLLRHANRTVHNMYVVETDRVK